MISAGTIGGILLILAAITMYNGKIFYASLLYIIADFFWIYLAYQEDSWVSASAVLIGTILNIGVFIKMNRGIFVKDLHK